MTPVFLDTVGILAAWDEADQWHAAAHAAYATLVADNVPMITTTFVLLECGNSAARREYRRRVNVLWDRLQEENALIDPTAEDMLLARAAFDRGEAGSAGIVDHVSFAVMRRLGLTQAFTNDRHFVAAGFAVLF